MPTTEVGREVALDKPNSPGHILIMTHGRLELRRSPTYSLTKLLRWSR